MGYKFALMTQVDNTILNTNLYFVGEGFGVVKSPFTVYDKHHAYSYVTPY